MTSASLRKATFISQKLQFLKDQGDLLIGAVGLYVSEIVTAGESWTEGGDNQVEYPELCQMIDTAVVSLLEKCEDLSARSVDVAPNQRLGPAGEQSNLTSQPATTQAAPTSHRQHTEPVQPADETLLKPVLARIAVIEEAWCSLRSNAEKVAEQQCDTDQQLKELLTKLSESDKKHNSKLKRMKEQITEINDTQVALDQKQQTRLQRLEKQLQDLSTTQDRMKEEMESQTELTEKLVHVPDQLESVKEKLDVLDARIGRIMDDCSNKHQEIEHVTRDLADKVMANTETVQVISVDQDQKTTLLRELETRMQTLEADSGRNVKDVRKQVEKGETNLRILCQMLNDRLTPLEQLRISLNERASTRDENIRQLTQVIQEVAVMSPRLQQLELKSSRTRCGFTAGAGFAAQVTRNTVRPYERLYSNVGGNFNAASGIFTAPVDGLYVAAISVHLDQNEYLGVSVRHQQQGQGQSSHTDVCGCRVGVKGTRACNVGVVDMKAGDILFVHVYTEGVYGDVYFSSFLLG